MAEGTIKPPPGYVLDPVDDGVDPVTPPPGYELDAGANAPKQKSWNVGDTLVAPWESMASFATGATAAPIAGWAGLIGAPLVGGERAGQITRDVQSGMTYQPRTDQAVALNELTAWPFEKIAQGADYLGGAATDVMAKSFPKLAPYIGAGVRTAPDAILAALGYGASRGMRPAPKPPMATEVPPVAPPRSASPIANTEAPLPGVPAERDAARALQAQERVRRAESLNPPVRLSKGQMERDPVQLRKEENLAQTDVGREIRDLQETQNKALIDNLDAMRESTGGRTTGETTGQSVAQRRNVKDPNTKEGALAMAARKSEESVGALYRKANNSAEGLRQVDPTPLVEWIAENEVSAGVAKSIDAVRKDLERKGIIETVEGEIVVKRAPTMREMEKIRQLAVQLGKTYDADGHAMSGYKKVIDAATEEAGGDLYKAARAARRQHAVEYENPRLIAKLLKDDEKGRALAFEKVWQGTVIGGSISELRLLQDTLLKHPDKAVRQAGKKAWKDMAGETIQYIRDEATKSVATDSRGNPNLSPAALRRAIDRIGSDKLELLIGKDATRRLNQLASVAQDTKTLPPWKGGSTTAPNLLTTFDKLLNYLPVAGPTVKAGVRMATKAYEESKAPKAVQEALAPAQPGVNQGAIRRREAQSRDRLSPIIPLSQVGLPMAEDRRRDKELRRSQGWAY